MTPIERAGYLAHAHTAAYRRREREALVLISEATDCAASVSWGKDSAVLLHLCARVNRGWSVLNARYPTPAERLPDMDRVRDAALALPLLAQVQYREVPCPGEWDMYERAGDGFADAETPRQRAAVSWW